MGGIIYRFSAIFSDCDGNLIDAGNTSVQSSGIAREPLAGCIMEHRGVRWWGARYTAAKNFAEYVAPGELKYVDTEAQVRRDRPRWDQENSSLSRLLTPRRGIGLASHFSARWFSPASRNCNGAGFHFEYADPDRNRYVCGR